MNRYINICKREIQYQLPHVESQYQLPQVKEL